MLAALMASGCGGEGPGAEVTYRLVYGDAVSEGSVRDPDVITCTEDVLLLDVRFPGDVQLEVDQYNDDRVVIFRAPDFDAVFNAECDIDLDGGSMSCGTEGAMVPYMFVLDEMALTAQWQCP